MNVEARIAAALSAPKTHAVITLYNDGTKRTHETRCARSAETFAIAERRKVGRSFIDRATGQSAKVVFVEVTAL